MVHAGLEVRVGFLPVYTIYILAVIVIVVFIMLVTRISSWQLH